MRTPSSGAFSALQAEQTRHLARFNETVDKCKTRSTALAKALTHLRNRCVELDRITAERISKDGLLDQEVALKEDLGKTRSLSGGQPWRLKEQTRIVPMQSRSLTKRLLGIGQAKRDAQAAALLARHGFTTGSVTHERLNDALSGIQQKKQVIRDNVLQSHARELQTLFVTAAKLATFDGMDAPSLDAYAERVLGRLQKHSTYADAFQEERDDLRAAQAGARKQMLRPLRERTDEIQVQLRTLADQEKSVERSNLLAAAGVTARDGAQALQQKLKALKEDCQFSAVYHTNAGCEAIQGLIEGRPVAVSASAIVDEIRRVHGHDVFDRGAAKDKTALKAGASRLTQAMAARINDTCHALALAEFRDGTRDYVTTYRQAQHSAGMLERLQAIAGTGKLLRPTRFLSTADNRSDILAFPAHREAQLHRVQFTIRGFSAMKTGSPWRVAGEGQERLYSTHSCFRVVSVEKDAAGIWQVTLHEQPANAGHRPDCLLAR